LEAGLTIDSTTRNKKRSAAAEEKPAPSARQRQIYLEAAKLFMERGFGGMSMSDLADAVNLTKAGLYHSITNKEDLLFTIIQYGMDDFEAQVFDPCRDIEDPLERLRTALTLHLRNVVRVRSDKGNPITSVVEQTFGLSQERVRIVTRRKAAFMHFLRDTMDELKQEGRLVREVDTTIAALSLIGMVIGTHKWFKPHGRLPGETVIKQVIDLALRSVIEPSALK
jgi:AcrR family transcriptional regulator